MQLTAVAAAVNCTWAAVRPAQPDFLSFHKKANWILFLLAYNSVELFAELQRLVSTAQFKRQGVAWL